MFGNRRGWAGRISWSSTACLAAATGLLMAAGAVADVVLRQPFTRFGAGQVVAVFANHIATGRARELTSYATFTDWRRGVGTFEQLSGYTQATLNLLGEPEAMTLRAAVVGEDFFATLGAPPVRGRGFRASEHASCLADVLVISDALWRTRFGGTPSVIGRTVRVEQLSGIARSGTFTIIGVVAPHGAYPQQTDVWLPYVATPFQRTNRSGQWFAVIGRLRAGVTLAEAAADMQRIAAAAQAEHPKAQPSYQANVIPLREAATERYRALVAGLGAAASLLLLVVVASISGVLAARALHGEAGDVIRLSLGARRRNVLVAAARDGLVMGLFAAALSLPLALGVLAGINRLGQQLFSLPLEVGLTWSSAGGGILLACGVATALAVLVKAHALRRILGVGVPRAAGGPGGTRATARLRHALVVGEIGIAVVLLAAAVQLVARVAEVRAIDIGIDVDRLLTLRVALPSSRYDEERSSGFITELLERVRRVPGVEAVAASSDDPLLGVSANPEFTVVVEGREADRQLRVPIVLNGVTATYFETLGLRLLDGEMPSAVAAPRELRVLVNRTLVRSLFPGEAAVGRRFRYGGRNPPWWTIAGVVDDTRNDGPLAPTRPMAYLPYPAFGKSDMTLLVRTGADAIALGTQIRTIVQGLDRDLPLGQIASARDLVEARSAGLQVGALVMALLAAAALGLSGLGLYSVLGTAFAQSAREIGVRMAVGAGPADVLRLVLSRTLLLVAAGLGLGTALTIAAGLAVRPFVAVGAASPLQIVAVLGTITLLSVLAAAWPAWIATRVRPMDALRAE